MIYVGVYFRFCLILSFVLILAIILSFKTVIDKEKRSPFEDLKLLKIGLFSHEEIPAYKTYIFFLIISA